jgi:6-phosphofructokinase 1
VAFDRVLAWRLGRAAVQAATDGAWGTVVGLDGDAIGSTSIEDVAAGSHVVPESLWAIPEVTCA